MTEIAEVVISADDQTKTVFASVDAGLKRLNTSTGAFNSTISAGTSNAIRNASYQVSDFIVQVQTGQGVMRAMSMQLPQLLAGFGTFGAVAGVVAGVMPAVVQAFTGTEDAAKGFSAAVDDVDAAFGDLTHAVRGIDFTPLYEQFNRADGKTRDLIRSQVELRFELLKTAAETARAGLGGALTAGGERFNLLPGFNGIGQRSSQLAMDLNLIGGDRGTFINTLRALDERTIGAGEAFQRLNGIVPITTKQGRELIETLSRAADEELRLKDAAEKYAEAQRRMQEAGDSRQIAIGGGKAAKAAKPVAPIDVFGSGSYITRNKETAESIKASFEFENWAWGELAKDADRAREAGERYNEALKKSAESLYAATDAGRFDKLAESLAVAQEAFDKGFISQDKLDAINAKLFDTSDVLKEQTNIARDLGMTFSSAFEDIIVKGGDVQDALRAIGEDAARILVRKNVTEPFAAALGKIDLGGLFSFDGGGYTGGGARSGGIDGKGGFLSILHPQETVVDHTKGGAAPSVTVVQHINVDSRSDRATIIAAMVQAKEAAVAAVRNAQQRGARL